MMYVVQQVMVEAEARAQRIEELRHVIDVSRRRPHVLGRDDGIGRLVVKLVLGDAVGRREAGNAALRATMATSNNTR